jgi:hypothetical protein
VAAKIRIDVISGVKAAYGGQRNVGHQRIDGAARRKITERRSWRHRQARRGGGGIGVSNIGGGGRQRRKYRHLGGVANETAWRRLRHGGIALFSLRIARRFARTLLRAYQQTSIGSVSMAAKWRRQ